MNKFYITGIPSESHESRTFILLSTVPIGSTLLKKNNAGEYTKLL